MASRNFDWKKYVPEALQRTNFLSLSTHDEGGSWTCPVYFAYDPNLDLYFISQPKSRHMRNIQTNGSISAAIYSTEQSPDGDIIGLQLSGKAVLVPDHEVERAYGIYFARRFPTAGKSDKPPAVHMGKGAEWKFVRIIPVELYYFDTRHFDEARRAVPLALFRK